MNEIEKVKQLTHQILRSANSYAATPIRLEMQKLGEGEYIFDFQKKQIVDIELNTLEAERELKDLKTWFENELKELKLDNAKFKEIIVKFTFSKSPKKLFFLISYYLYHFKAVVNYKGQTYTDETLVKGWG